MIKVASFGERFGGCFGYLIFAQPPSPSVFPSYLREGILLLIPILVSIIIKLESFRKQSPVEQ